MNTIQHATVIGAGTMGAQIAAHLANAGVETLLLDIAPSELNSDEANAGLALDDRAVRNRIARQGLERARGLRPAAFFTPNFEARVSIGNLEEDFEVIGRTDWVLEAVVEDLSIKRALMARIDAARGEGTLVSTNTSGIPVGEIAAGRSAGFRRNFLGTHFFNPPRYLKLLEVIPTEDTGDDVVAAFKHFADERLGKGVVVCKDTPNFIANRLGSVGGAFILDFTLEHGYTVEEVDALTGPLLGRPKTATFRLLDLVGLDVAAGVRRHLAEAIPDDEASSYLNSERANDLVEALIQRGWLGNKSGQGFYKPVTVDGKKEFWPLDLETLEHRPPQKPRFESVGRAKDLPDLGERLRVLLEAEDRAGALVRAITYQGLSYASHRVPEIADTPKPIDDAMRWGFMHACGPFEIWDALGLEEAAAAMAAEGIEPAPWVEAFIRAGEESFYRHDGGLPASVYAPGAASYALLEPEAGTLRLASLKSSGGVIEANDSASLVDLGDGVACVEFHAKANALDEDILRLMNSALDRLEADHVGLVIATDAENFSLGANLFTVAVAAQNEMWDQLDLAVRSFQSLGLRLRHSPKPVVAAPAGMALGGGCELLLAAPRVVAAAESYIGLVEVGAGVIPAGGGCKEMLRRVVNPAMRTPNADPLPFLQRLMETVGQASVGTSADDSRRLGYLDSTARVVMNRDRLLAEAKQEVLHLAPGYRPPLREAIYAAGRDALAALSVGVFMFEEGRSISEYDAHIGRTLASVLTGGDLSRPASVDETYILDLEREAFLSLCGEEKTQARMWHLLQTGKPLRN